MSFFNNMGTTELLIIGVVLVVLFGGKKLTGLAHDLGESGKEFKNVKREFDKAINGETADLYEKEEKPAKKPKSRKKAKSKKGGAK
jgi:sec-independent protein translocase protein TatA